MLSSALARAIDPALLAEAAGIQAYNWQKTFLRNPKGKKRRLALAHRQAGKTQTCALLCLHIAMTEPGSLIVVLSPGQRQSNEFVRTARLLHQRIDGAVPLRGDAVSRLEMIDDSRLIALPGGDDGDKIRGLAKVRLVLIDEASRVSDALVAAARPSLIANKDGELIGLTTPGPHNCFYQAWTSGDPAWELTRVTVDMSPHLDPEKLEEERRALGDRMFSRSTDFQWLQSEDSAFDRNLVMACLDPEVKPLWA